MTGPIRTCVACRRRGGQAELVRVVVRHGVLVVGVVGPGRGAWLCPDENCLRDALRKGALARALRVSVTDVAGVDLVSAFLNHVRA